MSGKLHFPPQLLPIAAAALLAWLLVPGSVIDRAWVRTVVRCAANPPIFLSGSGTHASPWQVRTLAAKPRIDPAKLPVVVALGDDPEGVFQSAPPSPVDMAVVLSNFQRLGARRAALAVVLAWDAPDMIGLAALDKTLGRFDSLVMAAPLSRGPVGEAMPPAFRNASLATGDITGDPAALPVVNRIPLPGVILGSGHALAGFIHLESEPAGHRMPLLARWDDRVVLSFPLLAAMQAHGVKPSELEIQLGHFLKLGARGPVVPIDRHGRFNAPLARGDLPAAIAATELIDAAPGLFGEAAPGQLILRDDRSAADAVTRKLSRQLVSMVATLASDTARAPARALVRLRPAHEAGWLGLPVLALAFGLRLREFPRMIALLCCGALLCGAQILAAGRGIWLPCGAAMAAWLAAVLLACCDQRWVRPR